MENVIREFHYFIEKNNITPIDFLNKSLYNDLKSINDESKKILLKRYIEDNFDIKYEEQIIAGGEDDNTIKNNFYIFFTDASYSFLSPEKKFNKLNFGENSFDIADQYLQQECSELNYELSPVSIVENVLPKSNHHSIDFIYIASIDTLDFKNFIFISEIDVTSIPLFEIKIYISILKYFLQFCIDKTVSTAIINKINYLCEKIKDGEN